jgi:hypothetical protein
MLWPRFPSSLQIGLSGSFTFRIISESMNLWDSLDGGTTQLLTVPQWAIQTQLQLRRTARLPRQSRKPHERGDQVEYSPCNDDAVVYIQEEHDGHRRVTDTWKNKHSHTFVILATNRTGQDPSCVTVTHSACHEITRLIRNPKFHYHVYKNPPEGDTPRPTNRVTVSFVFSSVSQLVYFHKVFWLKLMPFISYTFVLHIPPILPFLFDHSDNICLMIVYDECSNNDVGVLAISTTNFQICQFWHTAECKQWRQLNGGSRFLVKTPLM